MKLLNFLHLYQPRRLSVLALVGLSVQLAGCAAQMGWDEKSKSAGGGAGISALALGGGSSPSVAPYSLESLGVYPPDFGAEILPQQMNEPSLNQIPDQLGSNQNSDSATEKFEDIATLEVNAVAQDGNFLAIATETGLSLGTVEYEFMSDGKKREIARSFETLTPTKDGLISNSITSLSISNDRSHIVIGSESGLQVYDRETKAFVSFSQDNSNFQHHILDPLKSSPIRKILKKNGKIYVASPFFIYVANDSKSKTFTRSRHFNYDYFNNSVNSIQDFAVGSLGELIVATELGVSFYRPKLSKTQPKIEKLLDLSSIAFSNDSRCSNEVVQLGPTSVAIDKNGAIYLTHMSMNSILKIESIEAVNADLPIDDSETRCQNPAPDIFKIISGSNGVDTELTRVISAENKIFVSSGLNLYYLNLNDLTYRPLTASSGALYLDRSATRDLARDQDQVSKAKALTYEGEILSFFGAGIDQWKWNPSTNQFDSGERLNQLHWNLKSKTGLPGGVISQVKAQNKIVALSTDNFLSTYISISTDQGKSFCSFPLNQERLLDFILTENSVKVLTALKTQQLGSSFVNLSEVALNCETPRVTTITSSPIKLRRGSIIDLGNEVLVHLRKEIESTSNNHEIIKYSESNDSKTFLSLPELTYVEKNDDSNQNDPDDLRVIGDNVVLFTPKFVAYSSKTDLSEFKKVQFETDFFDVNTDSLIRAHELSLMCVEKFIVTTSSIDVSCKTFIGDTVPSISRQLQPAPDCMKPLVASNENNWLSNFITFGSDAISYAKSSEEIRSCKTQTTLARFNGEIFSAAAASGKLYLGTSSGLQVFEMKSE